MKDAKNEFGRLMEIMNELREKCPWDKEQTMETLRKLTIEETYELADAIIDKDMHGIKEELGDLLLHMVFYAKIGEEQKAFTIQDVLEAINQKLIYRHPHVFAETRVKDSEEVKANWEELKSKQGKKKTLAGVPRGLPALVKANRIQEKVRGVGFDWDQKEQIWDKIQEELEELKTEVKIEDPETIEKEFGDLLFSIINAARLYGVEPENALEKTNKKFMKRFNYLEEQTLGKGKSLHDMNLEEMNRIWEEAKAFDEK
jgi:XTP/dITP diphosphohydrolase